MAEEKIGIVLPGHGQARAVILFKSFLKLNSPKAAGLAVLLILGAEFGAYMVLKKIVQGCAGGNLLCYDKDLFCRNYQRFATDPPRNTAYNSPVYKSWQAIKEHGPYDVIVFGSSVSTTGWVEMLKKDYKLRVCNLSVYYSDGWALIWDVPRILEYYEKINGHNRALILYADIMVSDSRDFGKSVLLPRTAQLKAPIDFSGWHFSSPLQTLIKYLYCRSQRSAAQILQFYKEEELVHADDLTGLKRRYFYSFTDFSFLSQRLADYKRQVEAKGCRLAIVAFPTKVQIYEWLLLEKGIVSEASPRENTQFFSKAAQVNDIPFLDLEKELSPGVREAYKENKTSFWSRGDTHMNETGNRYTAEIIHRFIVGLSGFDKADEYVDKN